jgi:nitroreductase/NAD-dependent dihydropyrimidine dehydrogenase PreA subunit
MHDRENAGFMEEEFFVERGRPTISRETCNGCGRCVEICPDRVLSLKDGVSTAGDGLFLGCFACSHCAMVCPTGSILVTGRRAEQGNLTEIPSASLVADDSQFEALLLSRRSVRKFKEQEVEKSKIDRILEMAALAPMGIPPSQVGILVFNGFDKVRQFTEDAHIAFKRMRFIFRPWILPLMKPFVNKFNYLSMRDFVGPLLDHLVEEHQKGTDVFTYNAPAVLLFHFGPLADPSDAAIVATYAMLAAESLGLGNCMLGTPVALGHDKAFKEKYGIPPKNKVGLALIAGYPAVGFERTLRRALASISYC